CCLAGPSFAGGDVEARCGDMAYRAAAVDPDERGVSEIAPRFRHVVRNWLAGEAGHRRRGCGDRMTSMFVRERGSVRSGAVMRARWAASIIIATFCAGSSTRVVSQSFDGAWQSEGYGLYLDVSGATLKAFELTGISCLPSFTAERASVDNSGELLFKVAGRSS